MVSISGGDGHAWKRKGAGLAEGQGFDPVAEGEILRVELEGFLPEEQGFGGAAEGEVGLSEVIEDFGAGLRGEFGRAEEVDEGFGEFSLAELDPAEAVEVGGVGGFGREGLANEGFGLIEIFITLGPEVAEVVAGAGGRIRSETDGFFEEFDRERDIIGRVGGHGILEVEFGIVGRQIKEGAFDKRLMEEGEGFGAAVEFGQADGFEVGEGSDAREALAGRGRKFSGGFRAVEVKQEGDGFLVALQIIRLGDEGALIEVEESFPVLAVAGDVGQLVEDFYLVGIFIEEFPEEGFGGRGLSGGDEGIDQLFA